MAIQINKTILMSDAENFSNDQPINPYYGQEIIDRDKVRTEHANIRHLLVEAGVNVVTVPSPIDCQDGVYTANWALVRGNKAVLSRLPKARQCEVGCAKETLTSLGKQIFYLPEELKFSGQGDALACGNLLFCGSNYRSDTEAQKIVAETLGYERVQLQTVPELDDDNQPIINPCTGWPDSFFYDLDLALAVIRPPVDGQKGLIAYCPEAFVPESRTILADLDIDKIKVSIEEAKYAFATNLVSTGETVVMSAYAPILADELRHRGLEVLSTNITELAKGGGYIRCVTLTLD